MVSRDRSVFAADTHGAMKITPSHPARASLSIPSWTVARSKVANVATLTPSPNSVAACSTPIMIDIAPSPICRSVNWWVSSPTLSPRPVDKARAIGSGR